MFESVWNISALSYNPLANIFYEIGIRSRTFISKAS